MKNAEKNDTNISITLDKALHSYRRPPKSQDAASIYPTDTWTGVEPTYDGVDDQK